MLLITKTPNILFPPKVFVGACPRQGLRLGPTVSLHRRCSDGVKSEIMMLNYAIKMNVHRHARCASARIGKGVIFKYYRGA